MTRIFLPQPLPPQSRVALPEAAFKHLVQVLRRGEGDTVTVFNGDGQEHSATLCAVDKRSAQLQLGDATTPQRESALDVCIALGVSKGDRMDTALQKATELGATSFQPLLTSRAVVKLDGERWEKKLLHWQGVVTAAAEQSGRTRVPTVLPPLALGAWLVSVDAARWRLVLAPAATQSLPAPANTPRAITLLIGPEGGLDAAEIAQAERHGFAPWQLGPRVLRTETAPLAALAVLQARYGDLA